MAVKPTSKKAKAKSKPQSTASSEDTVVIDGTAEDVTGKTNKSTSAEAKPKADAKKESSPPPSSKSQSQKRPLSQFAMLMAVVALGLAGWAVFIGQKNIDPAWRGDLASRLSNVEAAIQQPTTFDDRHLARQENLSVLEAQITSLNASMTALSADLEKRIASAVPSSGQSQEGINSEALGKIKQDMEELRQEIDGLKADMATIKTDITTKISAAEPPAPENTNPDQAAPEDSGSWWQSLFGSIRISRLPDDTSEAK